MSKLLPEKQQKLHDVLGQLSDQYVAESREENLPEQKTKQSHPVLRWVAVAAAALLMLGVIFTASVMGNIAWKENHPDTGETPGPGGSVVPSDSGVVPGAALSDAGFDRERGVYVLSEAWADYAENVCGGTLTPDNVYAFALALQKSGQPVETERNIFVDWFVSSFSRDYFENADSLTGTVVFRPTDGAPAFGTTERDTYLYFLATLTNCLADHVYYSDYNYDQAYHNRYPKPCFDFSVEDYAGGFQKAAEEDSTKINWNRVYRVYLDRLAVYAGEDWETDYYLKMRREQVEVPKAVAAYSHLDVSDGVDMYFGAMASHLYYCILVARNDARQEEIRDNFMLGLLLPAKSELSGAAPRLNLAQAAAVLASFNLQPEDVRLIYQPIMISSYIGFPGEVEADIIETFGSAYLESLVNNSVILGQGEGSGTALPADKKSLNEPISGAETNILDFSEYADCTADDMKLKEILSSYKFRPYDGLTLYSQADKNKEMYSAILELGQPAVPYLLKTVFASEQNGPYEGFLTYCAYALSNAEGYMLEEECSGNTFSKHTSKYYAYNLWYNINTNYGVKS